MSEGQHHSLILEQFTRQAQPFSTAATIADADALRMIVEAARPAADDTMLDVACGPGLVVCAFSPHVREATGIDMTPAMLDRAHQLAVAQRASNVVWRQGDVTALPYLDASFTIVVTRFSCHHFLDPALVLREMVRVCAPGGRIVVVDTYASEDPAKATQFNMLEKLRDPSHARSLTLSELKGLFPLAGLPEPQTAFYELRDEVRNLLARSFPNPGDDLKIVEMFRASALDDRMGIPVRVDGDAIRYAYPVAILSARCPD
jgi:ubiquinone/menaquinone biosynthesis C-methylase UbiE